MSSFSGRTKWSDSDIAYLIKRAGEDAVDKAIAAELRYLNKTSHSEEDVTQMRDTLSLKPQREVLPPSFNLRTDVSAVKSSFEDSVAPEGPEQPEKEKTTRAPHHRISAARKSRVKAVETAGRKKRKVEPEIDPMDVPPIVPAFMDAANAAEREKRYKTLVFKPVYPEKYEKGGVYVAPAIGPVRYKGLESLTVTGIATPVETMVFEEVHGHKNPKTIKVIPKRVKDKNIRMPMDEAFLSGLLDGIEDQYFRDPAMPTRPVHLPPFFQACIESPDPIKTAQIICKCFSTKSIGSWGVKYGNQAIDLLAAEYATVTGMKLDDAKAIVTQKSGKPSAEYLSGNFESGRYPPPHLR